MVDEMFKFKPIYRKGVKLSGWEKDEQSYPRDCPHFLSAPGRKSHYRTWGSITTSIIPKTSTQEQQENGCKSKKQTTKGLKRNTVNFTSYPVTDTPERYLLLDKTALPKLSKYKDLTDKYLTVYKHSYKSVIPGYVKPLMYNNPHPLQNRLTKHELISDPIYCQNMFLKSCTTPTNLCVRQLRKRRNQTFNPWLGEYE